MSHPLIGHDYSERSQDESEKEYKKRKSTALGMALGNKGSRKLKVQSSQHGEHRLTYSHLHEKMKEPYQMESKKIFSGSGKALRELTKTMARQNKYKK